MNPAERLRYARGLNIIEVAKETGLTRQTISMFERGITKPAPATVAALAKFYDVSPDKILGLDPDDSGLKDAA